MQSIHSAATSQRPNRGQMPLDQQLKSFRTVITMEALIDTTKYDGLTFPEAFEEHAKAMATFLIEHSKHEGITSVEERVYRVR